MADNGRPVTADGDDGPAVGRGDGPAVGRADSRTGSAAGAPADGGEGQDRAPGRARGGADDRTGEATQVSADGHGARGVDDGRRASGGRGGEPAGTTLADIARQAGVSVSTVSKVLHDRSDVASLTRAKVQRLLEQHGYLARRRPALAAGGLIDFVINELDGPWAVELIRGAEDALHAVGMGMVVSSAHGRDRVERRWLGSLANRSTRGAILVVPELGEEEHEELRRLGVPYALIAPVEEPAPGVPWVGATNWPGGLAATRHLIRLGHRRIAVIGGPPHRLSSRARVDGYRSALDEAGLPFDPDLVRYGDFTNEPAYRHALGLLRLPEPPTAVFAGSDQQALSTYRAAAALGLRVPHDLSVVGFDDLAFADWVTPRLTTVRTPLADMAALAVRMVLRLLAGEQPETTRVEVASELVVRDSTAPPRAGS